MSIERFIRKITVQTAILWYNKVADGFGKFVFTKAEEIPVRWEDKTETKVGSDNKEFVSFAQFLTPDDIPSEAMILKEELKNLMNIYTTFDRTNLTWDSTKVTMDAISTELDPAEELDPYEHGAKEIRVFEKIPMVKSKTQFVRKGYL